MITKLRSNNRRIDILAMNINLKNRSTIQNIVKKYSETGRISKENRGGRTHFKVNEEIKTFVRELVDENCGLSLKQICQNVATRFDITLSETTIHNCLGQMHYSLKAIHIIQT
ncbi:hypothetical protein RF11_04986 [Thelohanellus kitauei]|uniref:Transposase Tc1-like domain-containing protein n=1 Tax=Thelohanellus kitauei TaxID=669202 RepID=A0A0C2J1G1_THEKT|nr:hypothetical protein RF11_04986 [Thelohanellus kitauei]